MDRAQRVETARSAARVGIAVFVVFAACQRSSLATPTRAPLIDLTAPRQVAAVAETRRILFGTGDRSALRDGWSIDERDPELDLPFVWATAPEATLAFQVLQVEDEQFLVKLSAFPGGPPQTITVLVNGTEVTRFDAQPLFLEYRFVVPAALLRRGENRLTFRHSSLAGRADGLESRRFAAAYTSIHIGPQCLPLRGWGFPPRPRVRRELEGQAPRLTVIGPCAIQCRLRVPQGAVLRYHAALGGREPAAATALVRVREADTVRELAQSRLSPSLFASRARDVEVDLGPWSGKSVELEIEVRPDACRAPTTTVVIDRAGIFAPGHDKSS
jgi:hypothetical protein